MHVLLTIIASTATTTGKKSSSGSSALPYLVILILFVGVYVLFIRPRSQRMRQQQSSARSLSIGDQVMSAGGIYGTVVALDTDVAEVEVSPGVILTFTRRAINARPDPAPRAPAAPEPVDEEWPIPHGDDDGPAAELDVPPADGDMAPSDGWNPAPTEGQAGPTEHDMPGDPPGTHP